MSFLAWFVAYWCMMYWVQGWVDADEAGLPSYEEIVGVHDDEDEAYGEQADHFEAAYNFRFEVSGLQTCLGPDDY